MHVGESHCVVLYKHTCGRDRRTRIHPENLDWGFIELWLCSSHFQRFMPKPTSSLFVAGEAEHGTGPTGAVMACLFVVFRSGFMGRKTAFLKLPLTVHLP